MTIREIPRSVYTIFSFIYLYEEGFRLKKQKYQITETEKMLLKKIYNAYDVYHRLTFNDFKKCCIEIAITTQQDLVTSGVNVAKILKTDLYNKITKRNG